MTAASTFALLPGRAFIRIRGEDARAFLQGLISNDIHALSPVRALYALLLTPQGKFLHDFFLTQQDDAILLECEQARAEELLRRLSMYRLRSKVALELLPPQEMAAAAWFGAGMPLGSPGVMQADGSYADPRLAGLGMRLRAAPEALAAWKEARQARAGGAKDYHDWRIACGVPEGGMDLIPEKTLPLDYGLDRLHAVDYGKGCYVGQEVTARMHYRATLRKRLYSVQADAPLPGPGVQIRAGDAVIGELRSCAGKAGLALLNQEEWEANGRASLQADGVPLRAELPAWNAT